MEPVVCGYFSSLVKNLMPLMYAWMVVDFVFRMEWANEIKLDSQDVERRKRR